MDPLKTKIIESFSNDVKKILKKNLIAEYLFGSYAKNRQQADSDIDILIVIKDFSPNIQRKMSNLASDYSLQYGIYISPILKDWAIWQKNQQHDTLFYNEVTQHGILL
jgi:uncharacterized protein